MVHCVYEIFDRLFCVLSQKDGLTGSFLVARPRLYFMQRGKNGPTYNSAVLLYRNLQQFLLSLLGCMDTSAALPMCLTDSSAVQLKCLVVFVCVMC